MEADARVLASFGLARTATIHKSTPVSATDSLWVLRGKSRPNLTATGTARVYEDERFELVATLVMAEEGESSFVNDVIITKTAAYFTDSFQPKIYKVRGCRMLIQEQTG